MASEYIQFTTDNAETLVVVRVNEAMETDTAVYLQVICQFCGERLINMTIETLRDHAVAHIANGDKPKEEEFEVPF